MVDDIQLRSDMKVDLLDYCGTDGDIMSIAKVSTGKDGSDNVGDDGTKLEKFLNFLMKNQHGSPFEHTLLQFRVESPIFVWREIHRHRIGFSYNEQSGRYMQLLPHYYVPGEERRLHSKKTDKYKVSSPSFHNLEPTPEVDWDKWKEVLTNAYLHCQAAYAFGLLLNLDSGLARTILPVGLYSACYITCNVRSLINFLHLRVEDQETDHSHPLFEMHQVASKMEQHLINLFPVTYSVWIKNGRNKL